MPPRLSVDNQSGGDKMKSRSEQEYLFRHAPGRASAHSTGNRAWVALRKEGHTRQSAVAPPSARKCVPASLLDNGEGTAKSQCG